MDSHYESIGLLFFKRKNQEDIHVYLRSFYNLHQGLKDKK